MFNCFLYWLSSSAAAVMFAALVAAAEPPAAAAEPPVAVPRRKRGRSHGFRCTENTRMKMKISAARRRARNLSEKATKLHNALNPTTNEMAAERRGGLLVTSSRLRMVMAAAGSTRMYKRGDQLNRRLWKRGVVSQVRAVREHEPDFLSGASQGMSITWCMTRCGRRFFRNMSRMQFSSLLRGGRFGSSGGKMGMGNRQPRAFTGIDVFRSQDWNKEVAIVGGRLGKPEHLAEMTRINAAWAALTDGERQCFRGRAQGETTVREQARQLATFSAVDELGLRPKARTAMMRDVATQAMKKIAEHPTWSAGLGIWHHAAAVAPSLVVGDAQADIEALRR
jgi:hypothetical protein